MSITLVGNEEHEPYTKVQHCISFQYTEILNLRGSARRNRRIFYYFILHLK